MTSLADMTGYDVSYRPQPTDFTADMKNEGRLRH